MISAANAVAASSAMLSLVTAQTVGSERGVGRRISDEEHLGKPLGPLLLFGPRTPQRNRNEWGETTVNKTWRKHLPRQEKSIT